jgi:hypothetical protein
MKFLGCWHLSSFFRLASLVVFLNKAFLLEEAMHFEMKESSSCKQSSSCALHERIRTYVVIWKKFRYLSKQIFNEFCLSKKFMEYHDS